jgi:hypothetical protein
LYIDAGAGGLENEQVEDKIVYKKSAFKHGFSKEDVQHAFENYLFDGEIENEEGGLLLVGLDREGLPLEILYDILDNETINVFHVRRCRPAWRGLRN